MWQRLYNAGLTSILLRLVPLCCALNARPRLTALGLAVYRMHCVVVAQRSADLWPDCGLILAVGTLSLGVVLRNRRQACILSGRQCMRARTAQHFLLTVLRMAWA